ncbi:MAG: anhydro-N-acetylmuramic acid kinase [Sedimentisphaerales bacterium]|nr:anhydro-N-acetylmuramic acid kinase [Sedimentisphaerales bacterium]
MPTAGRIGKLAEKKKLRVIGLMSGTSADGLDVAIVDIDESRQKTAGLLAFEMFPYPPALRRALLKLCDPKSAALDDICHYNSALAEFFSDAVINLCNSSAIALHSIDLIGSHGHTIFHSPAPRRFSRKNVSSTLQIGEPSIIAQRTGITTVADFRPRDMAAGGQGAPLVPYADYILFNDKRLSRAVQNIGGIANVTYLPACSRLHEIVAFDTGPGNMVIDRIIARATAGKRRYDKDGKMAANGSVNQKLLQKLLRHPFFRRRPPKSTGREEFGFTYADALYEKARRNSMANADIVATVTALTAAAIADAYRRFLPAMPDEVILSGGGAHNKTLTAMLRQELSGVRIRKTDELGMSVDAKEAVSFAILAYATVKNLPANVPTATGAKKPVILGKIVPA